MGGFISPASGPPGRPGSPADRDRAATSGVGHQAGQYRLSRVLASHVPGPQAHRPPLLPLFVVGFLAVIAIRSSGSVPTAWLNHIKELQNITLAAALFGLGTGVQMAKLRKVGGRPLILGLASWAIVGTIAYGGVRLIGA
ncbi:MAG: putative sulfate exporter family transporter [Acidimicrobiales bacterium]